MRSDPSTDPTRPHGAATEPAPTADPDSGLPPPDPAADSLEPGRELPRFAGLTLYALLAAGVFLFPILGVLALLFSLPYFASMFGILFFVALGGVALVEWVRLRGWRYSLRQAMVAWFGMFLILVVCAGLGYRQYRIVWGAERPVAVEAWSELSMAQRKLLAEELVAGHIHPTLAELIEFRRQADCKPRPALYADALVQEFAFAIGPWKLLGTECLVVRIDPNREEPMYSIEIVDTGEW